MRSTTAESWLGRPFVADLARRGRAALPRRVRPGVGRRRDDVVSADRAARGRRAAAAAARHASATSAAASSSISRTHRAPIADTPAPVRFLPEYDNVLLSHDDRSRFVLPRIARCSARRGRSVGARCWHDGIVSAVWRLEPDGLVVRHVPRPKRVLASIAAEGRRLARFLEADSRRAARSAQPVRPAPRRVSASAPRSEAKASASGTSIPLARA